MKKMEMLCRILIEKNVCNADASLRITQEYDF